MLKTHTADNNFFHLIRILLEDIYRRPPTPCSLSVEFEGYRVNAMAFIR